MTRAVRFDHYGDVDVLEVVDVAPPVPGPGQLLIRVKAAGINPGEAKIRQGALAEGYPATFPSGQGSDLAGVIEQLGPAPSAPWRPGDEIIGFTNDRSSQADLALVESHRRRGASPQPFPGMSEGHCSSLVRRRLPPWRPCR